MFVIVFLLVFMCNFATDVNNIFSNLTWSNKINSSTQIKKER